MKIRDSGMPDEILWASFYDAEIILTALGFDDPSANPTFATGEDFGCMMPVVIWFRVKGLHYAWAAVS